MKKLLSLLICLLMVSQCAVFVFASAFTDVPDDAYYAEAVAWAVENGITAGVSETKFAPNQSCTRAQAVSFLWRVKGCPEPEGNENPFADVSESAYYYKAVLWAVENGITAGTSSTTFSPNAKCTRGQIVTFLWNAEGKVVITAENPFTDVKPSHYYYNAVAWAVENEITAGTSADKFSPNATCTRAQIVTFLYRCYKTEEAPHEHIFGEWVVTTPATCTAEGTETRSCECGETETRSIEALGHSFGEWVVTTPATCTAEGTETRSCECGETETRAIPLAEHNYGDWCISVLPTYTIEGREERWCIVCDLFEERSIPVLVPEELVITTQPQSLTCEDGDIISFHVTVEGGAEPYSYQWQYKDKRSEEYINITSDDYTWIKYYNTNEILVNVYQLDFENEYLLRCVITDALGNEVISDSCQYTEYKHLTIAIQPENIFFTESKPVGTTTVVAKDGLGSYGYQWFYRIDGMPVFTEITESEGWAAGFNSAELAITYDEDLLDSNLRVYCKVFDEYGDEVESDIVFAARALAVVSNPMSVAANDGDFVSFSVEISGGTAPYTYQWYYGSDVEEPAPVSAPETTDSLNHDFNTYVYESDFDWHGFYYCVVTDSIGSSYQTEPAFLYNAATVEPLTVIYHPSNVEAEAGDEVTFDVSVSGGVYPYRYQWVSVYSDPVEAAPVESETANSFKLEYTLTQEDLDRDAVFVCVITDAVGNEIISNYAGIIKPLKITQQPQSCNAVEVGQTATFNITAAGGKGTLSYQWYIAIDGMPAVEINQKGSDIFGPVYNGYNTNSLNVVCSGEAYYTVKFYCVVTDSTGATVTSEKVAILSATLSIKDYSTGQFVTLGEEAELFVDVGGGMGPYSYQWMIKGADDTEFVPFDDPIVSYDSYCYFYLNVTQEIIDKGIVFSCRITDATGSVAQTGQMRLIP